MVFDRCDLIWDIPINNIDFPLESIDTLCRDDNNMIPCDTVCVEDKTPCSEADGVCNAKDKTEVLEQRKQRNRESAKISYQKRQHAKAELREERLRLCRIFWDAKKHVPNVPFHITRPSVETSTAKQRRAFDIAMLVRENNFLRQELKKINLKE